MKPNLYLKNRSAIYGIRNLINGKLYIGRTKCLYRRCHQYVSAFKGSLKHHINDHMMNSMNENGFENFEMFPIEFADVELLPVLEMKWINFYNSTDSTIGYNIRTDIDGHYTTHPSTSKKISANLRKQWASGQRDGHSEKLKKRWADNPDRRKKQGEMFSKIKTKYEYVLNGDIIIDYKGLCERGLKNIFAEFHRKKVDKLTFKGVLVERRVKGET